MHRLFEQMTRLILLAGLVISGCSGSPWRAGSLSSPVGAAGAMMWAPDQAASGSAAPRVGTARSHPTTVPPTSPAGSSPAPAPAALSASPAANSSTSGSAPTSEPKSGAPPVDARAIDELVARIAEREGLDPAAKARLADDLRKTDPALWPALMHYFHAALAYRRQAEGKQAETHPSGHGPVAAFPSAAAPEPRPANTGVAKEASGGVEGSGQGAVGASLRNTGVEESAPAAPVPQGVSIAARDGRAEYRAVPPAAVRPPEPTLSHAAPTEEVKPDRPKLAEKPGKAESERPEVSPPGTPREPTGASGVVTASFVTPANAKNQDPPDPLGAAIRAWESEARQAPHSSADVAQQARLRLLYLAAGRREEALRPIPSVSPAEQEFWSQAIYGLASWLDTERTSDPARRAAEAKQHFTSAVTRLGELAPLAVRNLTFATAVLGYGDLKPFPTNEFSPGDEVILYAEVENFKTEETPKGFHAAFRASYEIFDARNQRASAMDLGTTEEYCRNQRRDFFLNYRFRLPKRLYAGRHTLQLTIEDLKAQKVGQSSIEFTIKAGAE